MNSIVFRDATTDDPVLVLASGSQRTDQARVAAAVGEVIAKADAHYVHEGTA